MTTYSKETALYDTGAISDGINEASETATGYITDVTDGGIFVHTTDSEDPSDPTGDDTNNGVSISDGIDIVRNGVVVASYGENVNIGTSAGGNTLIDSNGMYIRDGETPLAKFTRYGAQIGDNNGARTVITDLGTSIYTPESVPAFNVSSGGGESQQKIVIEGIDTNLRLQKNSPVTRTYTELNNITNGTTFTFHFVFDEGDDTADIDFIKGTSSTVSHQFRLYTSGTSYSLITISFKYTAPNKFTYEWTSGTSSSYILLWPYSVTYILVVSDAIVDAPYGYSSGGAKIGSYIQLYGGYSENYPITNTYNDLDISETNELRGNAFSNYYYTSDYEGIGIQCNYDGIVMVEGFVRYTSGFTANDSLYFALYNTTQNTNDVASRYRAYATTPHITIKTPIWITTVRAGDILTAKVRNGTASRGNYDIGYSGIRAVYLAPILATHNEEPEEDNI